MNKRVLMFSAVAAAMAASSFSAGAVDFATADKSLTLAASEAQAHVGGTVLEVDRNGRNAHERYSAVVFDPNGILQHVAFNLPVDQMRPIRSVTTAQYTHTADLASINTSMIDAINKAEGIVGARASSAAFVASDGGNVIAYRVVFAGASNKPRTLVIDARSGEQLTDTSNLSS